MSTSPCETFVGRPSPSVAVLDTSALLAVITNSPGRTVVIEALENHQVWCASDLALAEGLPAIDRMTDEVILRSDLEDALRYMWDWLYTVPVDAACLDEAGRIGRELPARMSDAIHLAAARRMPKPTSFVTLDPVQIGLAAHAGLVPISP